MQLNYYYWYFKSVIPSRICDLIVKHAKETKEKELRALTGGLSHNQKLNKKQIKDLKKKRDSNIVWMNDEWVYKEILPYVRAANRNAGWNFEWDWSESCQFTIYRKGQYYDWHCDSWKKPYENEGPTKGKVRKLSGTVTLTDPKEYAGGELDFDFRNTDPGKKRNIKTCIEILPKGSLVVFPSFVWHRVKPVTKGERNSLVIWNVGYPFK